MTVSELLKALADMPQLAIVRVVDTSVKSVAQTKDGREVFLYLDGPLRRLKDARGRVVTCGRAGVPLTGAGVR